MNRKQFVILLALVVVIGAAGLLVHRQRSDSWHGTSTAMGQKLLPDLPINDISLITIKSGGAEVNLTHQTDVWRVRERNDYPANYSQISDLLTKIADLKVVQNMEIGPSQLSRFELLPPGTGANTGTSIEFKDKIGKTVGSLLVGKRHMKKPAANSQPGGMGDEGWPDGRYVMAGSDTKSVDVIADPLDSVQAKPEQWLKKDFLNIEKPSSITVQFSEATNSWTLVRTSETNDWSLADAKPGEKLDPAKISSVTSPFSSVNFNDVAAATAGTRGSNTVVTVETFDGLTYTSKLGPKQDDNYPASFSITVKLPATRTAAKDEKPDDKARLDKEFQAQQTALADKLAKESAFTNWVYQLPSFNVDEMLKTRQQLLVEASTNSVAQPEK